MIFDHPEFDNHESVVHFSDKKTGLKAIIAVHNTSLGPALGGCRMYDYATEADALTDVLRLSKGMSYKSALAGVSLGGGKSVIIGNPRRDKTPDLLTAFAGAINHLGGKYIVAADAGTYLEDLLQVSNHSSYVSGINENPDFNGGVSTGDPSPATAWGVLTGIKAALRYKSGSDVLSGVKIAIQGLGKVGMCLANHLHEEGAVLFVSDVNEYATSHAESLLKATVVPPEKIHSLSVDVFSPCALGAVINDKTVNEIRAGIVAGAANNQLLRPEHGNILHEKGILYAPDYAINAGGIIDLFHDRKGYDPVSVKRHIEKIAETLTEIFKQSSENNMPAAMIADKMAQVRLQNR